MATPLLLVGLLAAAARSGPEQTYDRLKASLFTIEVHSGNQQAKSVLGSGYLVSDQGHIVTNYHVVGSYIDDPQRYSVRARNHTGHYPLKLLGFDLVNDLAVLQAEGVQARALRLARAPASLGSSVVAFGNPEGLGLSLIEGIFNGFANKGLVDRMLLSMPLNSGMSGGPILNTDGDVIGTNVSVLWLSNSLSFGVPVTKVSALLSRPPLLATREALRGEIARQIASLEQDTSARVVRPFAETAPAGTVTVGAALSRRPPEPFECWDDTQVHKDEGVTKSRYGCNLQFTPAVEKIGEVGSVELLVEHFTARSNGYGFFGFLEQHAGSHNEVQARDPRNGVVSAPSCLGERVKAGELAWKINTCLSAFVRYPGFYNFDLVATSLSRNREALYVAVHMKGFRPESFLTLSRSLLEGIRPGPRP
jgi:hypothetical protein